MMAATLSVFALIVEPLKHIRAIPAFVILSFSRPLQSTTKLSSPFYSTLKNPISPYLSFKTTPLASFLLNECGFSLNEADTICRRRPDLLRHKSYHNARQTLLFLRDKGFHEIGVRKLFSMNPNLLRCSFQDGVKPKVEFLEQICVTGQNLFRTLYGNTGVLTSSIIRTLKPRVCFLQSVLDPGLAALVSNPESDKVTGKLVSNHSRTVSAISANPRILTMNAKIILGLVKDIEGMGIEKGSKAFARSFIALIMRNSDTVKRKLKILRDSGFTEEEIGIIFKKFPMFLGLSDDKLWEKLQFLFEEWKLPRNVILLYPSALGYNMEKRLKPRLNALRALMMIKSSKKGMTYPPGRYITMSEKDFHRKVVERLAP